MVRGHTPEMPARDPSVRHAISAEIEALQAIILAERLRAIGATETSRALIEIEAARRAQAARAFSRRQSGHLIG